MGISMARFKPRRFSALNEVTKDRDLSAYSPSVLKLPLQEKCWA